MRFLRVLLAVALIGGGFAVGSAAALDQPVPAAPRAVLSEMQYTFNPVIDGTVVTHDFVIRNQGTGPLNIPRVKTG